jgi:hypothetical protein
VSDQPGTFHQLTQQAKNDLAGAAKLLDDLIDEQRKPQPDPRQIAFLTLRYLDSLAYASRDVTTAAMQWAADQAEVAK